MQTKNKVVSAAEWDLARKALLVKEKELTRLRDQIARERQALPWQAVTKTYSFDGPEGKETLSDLFDGRSQLLIVHFMLGPGWKEGCTGCSFNADNIDGVLPHLYNHDVNLVVVSRAPLAEIEKFKKRMGWQFKWVSSNGNDFNYDYKVSFKPEELSNGGVYYNYRLEKNAGEEQPGVSAFYKEEDGAIFHTYSTYARGMETLTNTFNYLDIAPKGRNEGDHPMGWVKLHDMYAEQPAVTGNGNCCH
ncbi:thioredoxin family protein [Chitinophaga sp. sic0106]|uniref:DUF899 domain-containing protein n=1 Tax=Chitinophaga sp. sic0106 TaxID=2854785 RepID=UPI001C491324|nr:thioredoxin family protein [Chitinophaga sp. sic0106]MBV7530053.1 thioredoxin family protein [Chitinophaga sp. sic0106]